jgi:hypothetical protein
MLFELCISWIVGMRGCAFFLHGLLSGALPKLLLDAVKRGAQERGIPYTRFLPELIERGIASPLR